MSNRWRQGLYNKIYEKQEKIKEKQKITHRDIIRQEKLEKIEEELDDKPLINDAEFERLETRIEQITVEKEDEKKEKELSRKALRG